MSFPIAQAVIPVHYTVLDRLTATMCSLYPSFFQMNFHFLALVFLLGMISKQ